MTTATIDSGYLLSLARERSSARRRELVGMIAEIFASDSQVLSDQERAMMLDILERLVRDAERTVRKTISDVVAAMPDAPAAMVRFLANDEPDIAYPVLRESRVLGDEDLIEVVRYRSSEHQLAVAMRRGVSEPVTDALVETGNENVIATLLANPDAEISQATMDYLVSESERVDSFREPILKREDLDPELARRMFLWVSAALRKHILENFDLPKSVVDDLLEKAALRAGERDAKGDGENPADALARKLREKSGGDMVGILIKALRSGEVKLFEAAFRELTGLNRRLIQRILFEPEAEGLATACRAVGIEIDDFLKIYSLTQSAFGKRGVASKNTRRMIEFYGALNEETAREVLAQWRRDAGYLNALRCLEERL